MKTKGQGRFDLRTLRDLAGEKVFARGETYHRDGQVAILSLEPQRVLAQVAGTDDYRTEITGRGKRIAGECSCPAFEDRGFCKHLVATALAANAAGENGTAEGADALARIRNHLKEKGVDPLVEMIVDLAERDPALFRKLDLAAAAVDADDKVLEAGLRRAIDGATRTRGFVDYREAAGWADDVREALDAVADLTPGGRAGLALRLVAHAVARIERAVEHIDDSDGHCSALLERALDIHLAACHAARPDPVQLARDLFSRETDGTFDTFHGAARLYADVLSEQGLAEYRRLADEAWRKLPTRTDGRHAGNFSADHFRLVSILDFFAERDGDVQARIDLRARDLSSPWSYLQLAEFCRAQGREDEALQRAEEGLWVLEDGRLDERLVFFAVDMLSRAGRKKDAEAHLWRALEKAPSLELYTRLRKLGGKAAGERAVEFLEARLVKQEHTRWHYPADLLVRILMREKRFDAAWAAVRRHEATKGVKESLARASEATHPREAVETYVARIEDLANAGGNPAYAEAAELVARLAALRGAGEQAAFIADLKERHRRKRNFMKLLG
jgi:uncharacterized Zn finger protein